ncbi:MAG: GAF and ANTAR domain-containing protein [Spirochaetaceae bacterium]|nr:GAF and ANTAR domain-containing protein [Spirochaetaceae bacterium]
MTGTREAEVARSFVTLASSLANGYDVVELLDELTTDCARLLDVASAGLLLADARGVLHIMAASSEQTRQLEVFQLQRDEGPCLECYRDGTAVSVANLDEATDRWPQFAPAARSMGFASVHALPMRLRDNVLGALGLFGTEVGALNDDDLALGQALADVASVALVQDKAAADKAIVNEQLQTALTSRVTLEQAKGVLAQLGALEMTQAFTVLRNYARDHNLRLTEVAQAVVARSLPAQQVLDHARSRGSSRA